MYCPQQFEVSSRRPWWRLTNIPIKVRNGAATLRDVKNEDRSGYVHENKWRATKYTPILTGFLHENATSERKLTKSSGFFARKCNE
jgi:hypothetical protein